MDDKSVTIAVLVVAILAGFMVFVNASRTNSSTNIASKILPAQDINSSTGDKTQTNTLTIVDVEKHSTKSDCWMVIQGKVYDVSKFVPKHPGEEMILRGCGIDATQMFESRPDGKSHSDRARSLLKSFYIGDLN